MAVKRDRVNRAYRVVNRADPVVVLPLSAVQGISRKRRGDTVTLVDVEERSIFPGAIKDAEEYGKEGDPVTNIEACGDAVFDPMAPGGYAVFDPMA